MGWHWRCRMISKKLRQEPTLSIHPVISRWSVPSSGFYMGDCFLNCLFSWQKQKQACWSVLRGSPLLLWHFPKGLSRPFGCCTAGLQEPLGAFPRGFQNKLGIYYTFTLKVVSSKTKLGLKQRQSLGICLALCCWAFWDFFICREHISVSAQYSEITRRVL
jgi:hypothetical protein